MSLDKTTTAIREERKETHATVLCSVTVGMCVATQMTGVQIIDNNTLYLIVGGHKTFATIYKVYFHACTRHRNPR